MRLLLAALLLLLGLQVSVPALAQATTNGIDANAANPATPPAQRVAQPPAAAPAAPNANDPHVLPESGQAIVKLFVLAVLLESALALLFNWRPFVVYFDGRAVKPLVSFAAALVVVFAFGLSDLEALLRAYGSTSMGEDGARICRIIEAMIIAGGSSGVNNLLRNLGFRAIPTQEQAPKQPDKTDAWLSVGLHRNSAVGPVQVQIKPGVSIGTITGTLRKPGLWSFFLKDTGRLPASGGMIVEPNVQYTVSVSGEDGKHQALTPPAPQQVMLAPGAIVDLEFTL
jgi:hypothetical protein